MSLCVLYFPSSFLFFWSYGNHLLQVVLDIGFHFHWIQQSLEKVLTWKERKKASSAKHQNLSQLLLLSYDQMFVTHLLDQWLKVWTYYSKRNFSWWRNAFFDNISTHSIIVWYCYSNAKQGCMRYSTPFFQQ